MLSRLLSEALTSSGFRNGMTSAASTCRSSKSFNHSGRRRAILGSLTTNNRLSEKSVSITAANLVRACCAYVESSQSSGSGNGSAGDVPNASSSSLWIRTTAPGSQFPRMLSAEGGKRSLGRSAPSKLMTRVTADVPVRCMPQTMTQTRFDSNCVTNGSLTEATLVEGALSASNSWPVCCSNSCCRETKSSRPWEMPINKPGRNQVRRTTVDHTKRWV